MRLSIIGRILSWLGGSRRPLTESFVYRACWAWFVLRIHRTRQHEADSLIRHVLAGFDRDPGRLLPPTGDALGSPEPTD